MKREIAELLIKSAREKAEKFSNPNRLQNYTQETFKVVKIVPLSDEVAWVYYEKKKGNIARALFIWTNRGRVNTKLINGWIGFFPSDSHMLGLSKAVTDKHDVEEFNFDIFHPNYKDKEVEKK